METSVEEVTSTTAAPKPSITTSCVKSGTAPVLQFAGEFHAPTVPTHSTLRVEIQIQSQRQKDMDKIQQPRQAFHRRVDFQKRLVDACRRRFQRQSGKASGRDRDGRALILNPGRVFEDIPRRYIQDRDRYEALKNQRREAYGDMRPEGDFSDLKLAYWQDMYDCSNGYRVCSWYDNGLLQVDRLIDKGRAHNFGLESVIEERCEFFCVSWIVRVEIISRAQLTCRTLKQLKKRIQLASRVNIIRIFICSLQIAHLTERVGDQLDTETGSARPKNDRLSGIVNNDDLRVWAPGDDLKRAVVKILECHVVRIENQNLFAGGAHTIDDEKQEQRCKSAGRQSRRQRSYRRGRSFNGQAAVASQPACQKADYAARDSDERRF